jgi:UDP:flavonoid glycosyltransferase YjiC (YdhE family)
VKMLFTCRPTVGHFQPLAPLARAARSRGHAVAFATGEPIVAQARAAGFECFAAGLSDDASRERLAEMGVDFRALPVDEIRPFSFGRWFAGIEAPPRLIDLERICAEFRPDVIMHEVAELAGPLAATLAGFLGRL